MERLLQWTIKCFLTALSFTFVCGCDFDIVGRKTLVWGPCRSIQKSKELGFYVYSYRWIYTPYVCCEMENQSVERLSILIRTMTGADWFMQMESLLPVQRVQLTT